MALLMAERDTSDELDERSILAIGMTVLGKAEL